MKRILTILILLTSLDLAVATATAPATQTLTPSTLHYSLFFNWKFVWIKAGDATLTTHPTTYKGQHAYQSTLLANSSKTADNIFRLRDTLTTIVTPQADPLYFVKHCEEGKDIVYERAWFSRTPEGKHRAKQTKIYADGRIRESDVTDSRTIYDMVSLLLYARTFDANTLHTGQRLTYPMVTGRRVEEQVLTYLGHETIEKLDGTPADCLVFSLVQPKAIDGKTTESEVIRFYISNDDSHTPVQLDLFLKFGVAKAKLTE